MSRQLDSGCSLRCGANSSCGDCQELGHIDEEVARGEDIVQQAKTRRSALLSQVNIRRDALTSKLPVEIVCYIFEEYIKTFEMKPRDLSSNIDPVRPLYFAPIHRSGPLNLGTVCRTWRKLAWSHSQLWKTLVISVSCPGHDIGPTMVSEWLKRAGEQQLDIRMIGYARNSSELQRMKKNAMLIVQEVNRVSSRWHSLDLSGCPVDFLPELGNTGCASQSVLEHLCIGFNPDERSLEGWKLFEKSKHKHQPIHLSLLCPIQPSCCNIEWIRLTHLYLEQMSREHCSRILHYTPTSSPALRHLTLRLMDDSFALDFDGEVDNFRHFALETLVIHEEDCDPDTTTWLLNSLTLPALRVFQYDGDMEDVENGLPINEFLSLLTRSACSLETLELVRPWVGGDDDLARMLRAVPSLRSLKLELGVDNHIDVEELFICLSQKDLNNHFPAPFLPNLTRLNISAYAPTHWRAFIGMFADDPMIHTPDFGKTVPTRHRLQVTFRVHLSDMRGDFMDLMSLSQLAVLWKTHKFFAVFQFVDDYAHRVDDDVNFLLDSYRMGIMGLPRPALEKYTKLEQYLTTMSSLTF